LVKLKIVNVESAGQSLHVHSVELVAVSDTKDASLCCDFRFPAIVPIWNGLSDYGDSCRIRVANGNGKSRFV